jgi:tyrosyl-tRNA synthetase
MPLLEGLDGVQKMSKSLGNAVGLNDNPQDAFGKLMSISDELMWRYYLVLLNVTQDELNTMLQGVAQGALHPMVLKKRMAHDVVAKFWSEQDADQAQVQFEMLFQKRDLSVAQEVAVANIQNPIWIIDLLKQLNLIGSSSDGRRLIEQGGLSIDGQVIKDFKIEVNLTDGMIIKAGKHKIVKLKL